MMATTSRQWRANDDSLRVEEPLPMDLGLLDLGDEGGGREVVPDEADVATVVGNKPDRWCRR